MFVFATGCHDRRGENVSDGFGAAAIHNDWPTVRVRNLAWKSKLDSLGIIWGVAIGLAGLTKGPVVLGVHGMTGLVLLAFSYAEHKSLVPAWRSIVSWFARPRPLVAIIVIIAIVVPWIVAVERHEPGFIMRSVRHDLIERAEGSLEGHKGPPGYYLVTVWGTFFPWSVLLPATIVLGWSAGESIRMCALLAAVLGPWVMFEIVQTKLPHYLLPCFPPLAFLTADMLSDRFAASTTICEPPRNWCSRSGNHRRRAGAVAVARREELPPAAVGGDGDLHAAGASYGRWRCSCDSSSTISPCGAATMGIGMMLVVAIAFAVYLPAAEFLRPSPRIASGLTFGERVESR